MSSIINNQLSPMSLLEKREDHQRGEKADGVFDVLLSSFGSGKAAGILGAGEVRGFIDALFDQLRRKQAAGPSSPAASAGQFPFSPLFEATFGLGGPLPDYISRVTQQRGLTAKQNLALQNIAINNQDATWAEESVQKIAAELRAARIA